MAILYVETNFIISIVVDRDPLASDLLDHPPANYRIAIPGICFFEAFNWLEDESKRVRLFRDDLRRRIKQLERGSRSEHVLKLLQSLAEADFAQESVLLEQSARLDSTVRRLTESAECFGLTSKMLELGKNDLKIEQLTDNLILHSVIEHAASIDEGPKAFLTENKNDFGREKAAESLRSAGIDFFKSTKEFRDAAEIDR